MTTKIEVNGRSYTVRLIKRMSRKNQLRLMISSEGIHLEFQRTAQGWFVAGDVGGTMFDSEDVWPMLNVLETLYILKSIQLN